MAVRKQALLACIGNENMGIMQNGVNVKNNLSSRAKQPLGNINNIIHNQLGRNVQSVENIEKKKKLIHINKKQLNFDKIFQDNFEDACNYKSDDRSPEQKWLEEDINNSRIFDKIMEADKPRTKPITKEELDWIEYFEFGEKKCDISKDLNFDEMLEFPEVDIPELSSDLQEMRPPSPPDDLFKDLELSGIENDGDDIVATPIITSNFDMFNF